MKTLLEDHQATWCHWALGHTTFRAQLEVASHKAHHFRSDNNKWTLSGGKGRFPPIIRKNWLFDTYFWLHQSSLAKKLVNTKLRANTLNLRAHIDKRLPQCDHLPVLGITAKNESLCPTHIRRPLDECSNLLTRYKTSLLEVDAVAFRIIRNHCISETRDHITIRNVVF